MHTYNLNNDSPIIVTGGAGFIGSNFILEWISCAPLMPALMPLYSFLWPARWTWTLQLMM